MLLAFRASPTRSSARMISAHAALERLREGNRRFVSEVWGRDALTDRARRMEVAAAQAPFAAILGCSDSRVPVEIVFDQGLGDLFVIRVAGNIVAPSQIGSVEFAAERTGTRLVVVLGHSQCGAIQATLEELQRPAERQSRNLYSIVDRIRPVGRGIARDRTSARPRRTGASRRTREHPGVGRSPAAWLAGDRAAHRERRAAGGRGRVLA